MSPFFCGMIWLYLLLRLMRVVVIVVAPCSIWTRTTTGWSPASSPLDPPPVQGKCPECTLRLPTTLIGLRKTLGWNQRNKPVREEIMPTSLLYTWWKHCKPVQNMKYMKLKLTSQKCTIVDKRTTALMWRWQTGILYLIYFIEYEIHHRIYMAWMIEIIDHNFHVALLMKNITLDFSQDTGCIALPWKSLRHFLILFNFAEIVRFVMTTYARHLIVAINS